MAALQKKRSLDDERGEGRLNSWEREAAKTCLFFFLLPLLLFSLEVGGKRGGQALFSLTTFCSGGNDISVQCFEKFVEAVVGIPMLQHQRML